MKVNLAQDKLSHDVKNPSSIEEYAEYWAWIPRKEHELKKKSRTDVMGWGVVVTVDYRTFVFM
jgi:hypothetical protein